jgi:pyruvate dehydrogenase E2 component (dihydrolipoamide acetyltransferase)
MRTMATPISIPRLGWNMDEGVFIGWVKKEGDTIAVDDALFTLESDKATEDIPSLGSGTLRILQGGPKPGDSIAVGTVIGHLVAEGEVAPASAQPVWAARAAPGVSVPTLLAAPEAQPPTAPAASPRARRIADELGVDWKHLKGSGSTGRIRERDVRALAAAGPATPLSSTRRRIGQRLQESLRVTVPVTLVTTADATCLVQLHRQFQVLEHPGAKAPPTYTDIIVKLVSGALQHHPHLNAHTDGARIQLCNAIHIGIAVDAEAGLLVPVIRDVPTLPLQELASCSWDLIDRARRGQLTSKDMQGGTFTVSNLGSFGVDAFTPILNPPECAILGVGRIQRRPSVREDQIVVRDEITLCLTFDHCSVDGAPAARFLQTLCERVENPGPWLVP